MFSKQLFQLCRRKRTAILACIKIFPGYVDGAGDPAFNPFKCLADINQHVFTYPLLNLYR